MTNLIRQLTPRTLRNWIRQPRRSARYVWDRVAYACIGERIVEVSPGWSVRCHPASESHFAVFARDPLQAAELKSFSRHCSPGMQLLDIGAHYGLFALAAAWFGGPHARIVSVEASGKAAVILKANIAANQVENRVTVLEAAMGATDGMLEMLSTGPAGSDYFVSAPVGRSDTIQVRQLSMTSAINRTKLIPTHIKMDIEGFESDVIPAAAEYLKQQRPILFLELHGRFIRDRGRNPECVIETLRACGYNKFEQNGHFLTDSDFAKLGFEARVVASAG